MDVLFGFFQTWSCHGNHFTRWIPASQIVITTRLLNRIKINKLFEIVLTRSLVLFLRLWSYSLPIDIPNSSSFKLGCVKVTLVWYVITVLDFLIFLSLFLLNFLVFLVQLLLSTYHYVKILGVFVFESVIELIFSFHYIFYLFALACESAAAVVTLSLDGNEYLKILLMQKGLHTLHYNTIIQFLIQLIKIWPIFEDRERLQSIMTLYRCMTIKLMRALKLITYINVNSTLPLLQTNETQVFFHLH